MSVKQRLKKYVSYIGMSERQFALSIGVSAGYINAISKSIQPDKLSSITVKYPELNPIWLMTGDGEMLLNMEEKEIETTPSPSVLLEAREKYDIKEERLLSIIESQQRTIENLSETSKKSFARMEENVTCAAAAGSDLKK